MQHLMIHLPRQARLAGPVQNTWMYRFERGIGKLRKKVRNKARVEGSIAEAYLVDEATNLFSLYFKSDVHSVRNKPPRYDEMFQHPGRCLSYMGHYDLTTQEYKVAFLYILTNMPEMDGFFTEFDTKYCRGESTQTDVQQRELILNGSTLGNNKCPNFFSWFKSHCQTTSGVHNALRQMSYGFPTRVKTYGINDVNGYRFHSEIYEQSRTDLASCNVGACVTSFDEDDTPVEYFGIIEEILQISWEGNIELELVIFKCHWFDPTSEGTRRTPNLGLVEVMHNSRIPNFDPFVLASQVKLVYYLSYACQSAALAPWWIVYVVPPTDRIPHVDNNTELPTENLPVFQEDGLEGTFVIDIGDDLDNLDIPESYEITDPKELEDMTGLRHRLKRPASQPDPPSNEPQENNNESPSNNNENGTTAKKRKGRTRTQLKNPPNGVRIAIKPEGDDHFIGDKGIGGQITALLKRECPSIIKEKNKEGLEIKRHASSWDDYYINKITEGENIGQSAAHCFMSQFWSIYKLADDGPAQRIEADNVLENAARRQFRQMWYQARKESVKLYYRAILQQPMKDHDACTKQLAKNEYMQAQLYWCTDDEVWESICDYWCSSKYKGLRELGQQSRFKSESIAQNRGGSRSFVQTKIVLGEEYGPAAATNMNTYKCMKAGVTKCTETGESGPMNNVKAQKRVDDYIKVVKVAHPENWEEHDLDPEIVYSSGGGMPHGRLAMGNGAIKKAVVFAKAREKDIRPSNSMSYQDLSRKNVQLERHCKNDFILSKHLQIVYGKMGWEIPGDLLAFHDELVDDSTGDPTNSIFEAQDDGAAS